MIVVDSSALIAIFEAEADAAVYAHAIRQADRLVMSAVNVYEIGIVMRARHGLTGLCAHSAATAKASIPKPVSISLIAPPMRWPPV